MHKHLPPDTIKFILRPIKTNLEDFLFRADSAFSHIGASTLIGSTLDAIFLKTSGALEQKVRCIQWQVAADDFDLRNELISKSSNIPSGEDAIKKAYASFLKNVQRLYSQKIEVKSVQIPIPNTAANCFAAAIFDNAYIVSMEMQLLKDLFKESIFNKYFGSMYMDFEQSYTDFATLPSGEVIKTAYDFAIRHRNYLAHNVNSIYAIPLNVGAQKARYHNYLLKLSILMCIDAVFTKLFEAYELKVCRKTY